MWTAVLMGLILGASGGDATFIDLRDACILVKEGAPDRQRRAAEMLVHEVATRSRLQWPIFQAWSRVSESPVIVVALRSDWPAITGDKATLVSLPEASAAEGYTVHLATRAGAAPIVALLGNDERGLFYAVGKMLRSLRTSRDSVRLAATFSESNAPKYPLRGHQLGYRPKTNSYDAWDVPQWEQYYRDLIVFGANAVELIPPRSDDDDDSPHFPRPKLEMMARMSHSADNYGLSVWVWYPALDHDYSNPKTVEFALQEWDAVLSSLPRLDAVFIPTGDPGDTPPKHLMPMLEKQTRQWRKHHPKAEAWISMQSFNRAQWEEMIHILREDQPEWLTGVVFGPQTRVPIAELRKILPERYPIRRYPDITHSMRCEYPVPAWDLAYAMTEAREVINPRPRDQAIIFHAHEKDAIGFLTYSEGCNDDVNKTVWSALGWDPQANISNVLRDYARYFISGDDGDAVAQLITGLEDNWRGPLATNASVPLTLAKARDIERSAAPQQRANWRLQQLLYRAYYDAYQQQRLIHETSLENRAMEPLQKARQIGSHLAVDEAERILDTAVIEPVAVDLRARVFELAEALFQSIKMQLSVDRYQAIDVGRGANLDTIDVPLNNRVWLTNRFRELRALEDEKSRLDGITKIVDWTNPGPGGFYDDLGNPSRQPHLVAAKPYVEDPGFLTTPTQGFRSELTWRRSWCDHIDGLYGTPVTLKYPELDPHATYRVRVVYAGDNAKAKVRLVANDKTEIHPLQTKPFPVRPVEYAIPQEAMGEGSLTLTWHTDSGPGPGRGAQIAEVWLIRVPASGGK